MKTEEIKNEQIENQNNVENLPEAEEATQATSSSSEAAEESAPTAADDDKMAELAEQVAQLKDKNLRMMAEFDNYRKRTAQEKLQLRDAAQDDILKDMLPLIDDFDRAIQAIATTTDTEAVKQGIMLIYNKFQSFLSDKQVEVINTQDAPFDVEQHEAITTIPAPTPELKDHVIDCTKKGYMRNGKILRYAQVVVGQ